ncbi:alkene reductase [Trichormus variabilis]|uniref:Alkene reductase n=1 Tax=Trichormus variabilis SAG 1403-4b TaxID=447716 RepID=A0A3S1AK36_ANAVA|nr:alkene reductase [Trichormus variabilis]MBD2629179.1 alkene reductase [Trichormus variabilis FACHB-164]RUS93901.1 alkene reductase [Trichormus variabilis SAG 1403-4b]
MSSNLNLFAPVQMGAYILPNRIVMAPMTRLRAIDSIPNSLMATYYAQRASAGLIVTECTMVSPLSLGYINCPGIYSAEQVAGWRLVTDAVHEQGGRIFLQLWHSGRVSHSSLLGGELPVAPSAIAGVGSLHTPLGKVSLETPRALEIEEITGIVEQFRQGAKNALAAGFDGVELHGAFGYLIDQFLQDGSNQRTDEYGGSIENRSRFLLEVVAAVVDVWGGERVGIKLSPSNTFYGMQDSNPQATFGYVIKALNAFGLAYLHLMEPNEVDLATREVLNPVITEFRSIYPGTIITNGGYDGITSDSYGALRERIIISGNADLVSFGKLFISNPDLPKRLQLNAELNTPDPRTFYAADATGYTDYPFLES